MDEEKEMQKSCIMSSNLHSWWMKVLRAQTQIRLLLLLLVLSSVLLLLYSTDFWKATFWEGMGWDGGHWLHEYLNMCHLHSLDYILLLLLHPPCPSKNNRQDPKETSVVTDLKEASLVNSTLEHYSAMFPHFKPEAQIFPLSKLSWDHLDRISCEM